MSSRKATPKRRRRPAEETSWTPIPLRKHLDAEPEPPSLLERDDGAAMLYPGKLHAIQGEPEAGKGWLAHLATHQLVNEGRHVLYIDYEDDVSTAVERQLALGTKRRQLVNYLHYVQPSESVATAWDELAEVLSSNEFALAVVDGLTEAYDLEGLDSNDNQDVAAFLNRLPRPIARFGPAVLQIDHVTKSKEGRGRYAIGGQHKLAGIDVAYSVENVKPFGRGRDGRSRVKVMKDRKGWLRRRTTRDKLFAELHLSEKGGKAELVLESPEPPKAFALDEDLVRRVSKAIEEKPGLSGRAIKASVTGKGEKIVAAVELLINEGYVETKDAKRGGVAHYPIRPYGGDDE